MLLSHTDKDSVRRLWNGYIIYGLQGWLQDIFYGQNIFTFTLCYTVYLSLYRFNHIQPQNSTIGLIHHKITGYSNQ